MKPGLEPEQVRFGKATGQNRDEWIRGLRLTAAASTTTWRSSRVWKRAATVLVSDGVRRFDVRPDEGLRTRLFRYTHIQGLQSQTLRKRWLLASFSTGTLTGAYYRVSVLPFAQLRQAVLGLLAILPTTLSPEVRTDMDGFSTAEIQVLENHGNAALAEAAIGSTRRNSFQRTRRRLPCRIRNGRTNAGSETRFVKAIGAYSDGGSDCGVRDQEDDSRGPLTSFQPWASHARCSSCSVQDLWKILEVLDALGPIRPDDEQLIMPVAVSANRTSHRSFSVPFS